MKPTALGLLAFALATTARAEPPARLEVELGLGVSGSLDLKTVVMASALVELSAPVSAEDAVIAQWGFTLATGEPTDPFFEPTYASAGNLLLGWAKRFGEGVVLAPSFVLPVATRPDRLALGPASSFAFGGALGLRGGLDRWLWSPDQLSLILPLTLATWLDPVLIETHLKVGLMIPTQADDPDEDFVLQAQTRLAARLGGPVWVALGLGASYVPTDTGDNASIVLEPELRYVLGPGSHVEASLTMNLDGPLGPFWEPGRFWAVVLGASAPL